MSDTAQTLRLRFEGRSAISHPTRRPGRPRGCMNCETIRRPSRFLMLMIVVYIFKRTRSQAVGQVNLSSSRLRA